MLSSTYIRLYAQAATIVLSDTGLFEAANSIRTSPTTVMLSVESLQEVEKTIHQSFAENTLFYYQLNSIFRGNWSAHPLCKAMFSPFI